MLSGNNTSRSGEPSLTFFGLWLHNHMPRHQHQQSNRATHTILVGVAVSWLRTVVVVLCADGFEFSMACGHWDASVRTSYAYVP